jgi:hypothetical protein
MRECRISMIIRVQLKYDHVKLVKNIVENLRRIEF